MKKKQFKVKGIFRSLSHYLEMHGESDLEERIIRKICGRPQNKATLEDILTKGGLSSEQAKKLIKKVDKTNYHMHFKKFQNVSPSLAYYKSKDGIPKSLKPFQGGSPGLGKRKS